MVKTLVTKSMTEKDIMKTWDIEDGYTDAKWRMECERRSTEIKKKTCETGKANDKQYGGDHYKNMGVEPWDVVDTWPIEQRIGAYRHGASPSSGRL